MLETAIDITRRAKSTSVQDASFADELVILSDAGRRMRQASRTRAISVNRLSLEGRVS
jgi:hypothetical protein